jgi:cytoskeleton-associated protein 5
LKKPPTAGTSASATAPPAKKAGAAPSAAPSKPSKGTTQPGVLDTFKYKHTPEDSEALAAELIPSTFLTDLVDANWKTRLAALEEMTAWVENTIEEIDAEVVVRALAKRCWGDKNFQASSNCSRVAIEQFMLTPCAGVR